MEKLPNKGGYRFSGHLDLEERKYINGNFILWNAFFTKSQPERIGHLGAVISIFNFFISKTNRLCNLDAGETDIIFCNFVITIWGKRHYKWKYFIFPANCKPELKFL
jgi:hypothetical protein